MPRGVSRVDRLHPGRKRLVDALDERVGADTRTRGNVDRVVEADEVVEQSGIPGLFWKRNDYYKTTARYEVREDKGSARLGFRYAR